MVIPYRSSSSAPPHPPAWLTLDEAARELRVASLTLRRKVKSGVVPGVKLPGHCGRYLIPRSYVEGILQQSAAAVLS